MWSPILASLKPGKVISQLPLLWSIYVRECFFKGPVQRVGVLLVSLYNQATTGSPAKKRRQWFAHSLCQTGGGSHGKEACYTYCSCDSNLSELGEVGIHCS